MYARSGRDIQVSKVRAITGAITDIIDTTLDRFIQQSDELAIEK